MIDPRMNSHKSKKKKVSLIYLLCYAMCPCQMDNFSEYFPPHICEYEVDNDAYKYQSHLPSILALFASVSLQPHTLLRIFIIFMII